MTQEDREIKELAETYGLDEKKLRRAIEQEEARWDAEQNAIEEQIDSLVENFEDDKVIRRQLKKFKEENLISGYAGEEKSNMEDKYD